MRLEILYRYGGIYLDADLECIHPLDDSLLRYHCFTCYENEVVRPQLIANGVIGCEPHHPLIRLGIEAIHGLEINRDQAWKEVGPLLFTKLVMQHEILHGKVKILPSYAFYPVHYTGVCYRGKGKVYALHYWNCLNHIDKKAMLIRQIYGQYAMTAPSGWIIPWIEASLNFPKSPTQLSLIPLKEKNIDKQARENLLLPEHPLG